MSNADTLNAIYKKYGLEADDIFKHKHYKIITRGGIEKIQAAANITITYKEVFIAPELSHVVLKAIGTMPGKSNVETVETYGECSTGTQAELREGNKIAKVVNNTNAYPFAMSEKRALSRAVLKLTGLYALGHFGEDEAESFKKPAQDA